MGSSAFTIGVDLGGTKIAAGIIDERGQVVAAVRYATEAHLGADAVIERIADGARRLQRESGLKGLAMGIGVAGQIAPVAGTVRFAPNLDWRDVPLRGELESRLSIPVAVSNDVRAALWGEWLFGAGKGIADLLCVFVGTGVGGGIISGGHVLDGCSNTAGEIGHITVEPNGAECSCGNRGCMEAVAGGWAIAKRAMLEVARDPDAGAAVLRIAGGVPGAITARHVVDACRAGDPLAAAILNDAAEALGAGISSLVNTLNPRMIVLGGGIVDGMPELVSCVEKIVHRRSLAAALAPLSFTRSELGRDAGVIGAAAIAMRTLCETGTVRC